MLKYISRNFGVNTPFFVCLLVICAYSALDNAKAAYLGSTPDLMAAGLGLVLGVGSIWMALEIATRNWKPRP